MYEKSRTRDQRLESLEGKRKEGRRGKKKNFDCSKKTRQGEGEEGNFKDIATVIFNDLGICSRDRSSWRPWPPTSAIRVASPWKPGGENRNRPRLLSKVTPTLILEQSPSATVRNLRFFHFTPFHTTCRQYPLGCYPLLRYSFTPYTRPSPLGEYQPPFFYWSRSKVVSCAPGAGYANPAGPKETPAFQPFLFFFLLFPPPFSLFLA